MMKHPLEGGGGGGGLCFHGSWEPREALEQGSGGIQLCRARLTCLPGTGCGPVICLGEAQAAEGPVRRQSQVCARNSWRCQGHLCPWLVQNRGSAPLNKVPPMAPGVSLVAQW